MREYIKKLLVGILLVVLGVILFLFFVDIRLNKIIGEYINEEVERLTTNIISQAASQLMVGQDYKSFILIEKDKDGEIKNIEYQIDEINKIKRKANILIHKKILELENGDVSDKFFADRINTGKFKNKKNGILCDVSLGSVRDSTLFSNIGPTIPIKLLFIGQVESNVDVKFKDYGINNVIVQIDLIVSVKEQIVMPTSSKRKRITIRQPISINIIKGDVPSYYVGGVK